MHKSILLPITQSAADKTEKVFFCRNSSLVTFLSICLIMKWLECDELKSRLVTDNHV